MNNHLQCRGLIQLSTCSINCKNESNSETYLMVFSPTEWTVDWIGLWVEMLTVMDWIGLCQ